MSACTGQFRETALAECQRGPDEPCEHRDAALAYRLDKLGRGVGFDWGALLAWMALAAAFLLLAILLSINVARWWWS